MGDDMTLALVGMMIENAGGELRVPFAAMGNLQGKSVSVETDVDSEELILTLVGEIH